MGGWREPCQPAGAGCPRPPRFVKRIVLSSRTWAVPTGETTLADQGGYQVERRLTDPMLDIDRPEGGHRDQSHTIGRTCMGGQRPALGGSAWTPTRSVRDSVAVRVAEDEPPLGPAPTGFAAGMLQGIDQGRPGGNGLQPTAAGGELVNRAAAARRRCRFGAHGQLSPPSARGGPRPAPTATRDAHSGEVKPTRPALFGVGHQRVTLDPGLGHAEIFGARRPETYRRMSKVRGREFDSVEIPRSDDAGTTPR